MKETAGVHDIVRGDSQSGSNPWHEMIADDYSTFIYLSEFDKKENGHHVQFRTITTSGAVHDKIKEYAERIIKEQEV